jgi:V8-like Glu-specific endopeptidase
MASHRFAVTLGVILAVAVAARPGSTYAQAKVDRVAAVTVAPLDLDAIRAEDIQREAEGLPPRFAIPHETLRRPATDGAWDDRDPAVRRWSLRINSPGALSLNLGFTAYYMPEGGELIISATDGSSSIRPFTAADNAAHGELWTPVILSDDILVEVRVPRAVAGQLILELTSINVGYRFFGEPQTDRSGACNIDVVCPQGDGWRNEIPAIGVISTGGSLFCTGFMVNNTAWDSKPYFMTANHCGINGGNAASLVVYWNFQSPTCGQHGGGSLSQFQTGSFFRASYSTSDFTLVELDEFPNPAWNISYAGWDHSDANSTSSVCIHHPNCDEKSISFDYQPSAITSYLGGTSPGDGTHLKVDWDLGVTEPGSSGSPLFDQNHHVIGQLHGGYSACGSSDMRDWYGRFFRSWTGGGSNSTRLSNWLDPGNTGATYVDTLVPGRLEVTPDSGLNATGEPGGPFTPDSIVYTLSNMSSTTIDYAVSKGADWISLSSASGTLPGQSSVQVTVSLNANANALDPGIYSDTISFANLTNHSGDTTRAVSLQVGHAVVVYSFPLASDPGWTTQGQWAFGQPTGQGGDQHGFPDPTSGATGPNVYGVNLNGDYSTTYGGPYYLSLGPVNLSTAAECTLKFQRWLNSDYGPYVQDTIEVSSNGTTWATVWTNGGSVIQEQAWSLRECDLSATADHQPTVYIRWGYRIAAGAFAYSGWNIDDVEIWGFTPAQYPVGDMDCSHTVDFGDINPFVLALSNPATYAATFPNCDIMNGDINGDGSVDFGDINPFVALLSGE